MTSSTSHIRKRGNRVVIADGNREVRDKVVQLLQPDFDVVGAAADGKAALEVVMLLKPELVVLDISLPRMSGMEVLSEIKKRGTNAKIVVLTVHEDPDFVKAALQAGASGYVVKSHMAAELVPALSSANEGGVYISPSCAITGALKINSS
jgi:DNA-binding NarL/FixJ family response regulator